MDKWCLWAQATALGARGVGREPEVLEGSWRGAGGVGGETEVLDGSWRCWRGAGGVGGHADAQISQTTGERLFAILSAHIPSTCP